MAPQESFLNWLIRSTGLLGLLIPPLAILCFILTVILVFRGKGPLTGVALLFIIPLPVLLGLLALIHGGIQSLQVIFYSSVPPNTSEFGDAISTSLVGPMMGLLLTLPSYLLAMTVMFVRSFPKSPKRYEEISRTTD